MLVLNWVIHLVYLLTFLVTLHCVLLYLKKSLHRKFWKDSADRNRQYFFKPLSSGTASGV